MKKRFLSLFLALLFVLSLAACSSDIETEKEDDDEKLTTQEQTEEQSSNEGAITAPEAHKEAVDTAALDQIENQDTFAVRIIKKEAEKGAFDVPSIVDPKGEDGYILTVLNNTGAEVDEIKFLVLATDANGKACSLPMLMSPSLTNNYWEVPDYNKLVYSMGIQDANLVVNSSMKVGVQCNLNSISYMNIIVLSYIDNSGNEIYNENAYNWLINTLEK